MLNAITSHKQSRLLDIAAISLSGLCLLHCLGTSLLLGLVASSKLLNLWHSELMHIVLLIIAAPLTLWTLVRSYRCHGSSLALLLGISGLKLMALALVFYDVPVLETRITVAGVLLLAIGHMVNLQAHRAARFAD